MSKIKIAGYLRISVDIEKDKDSTSIENQRRIIQGHIAREFPDCEIDFFTDRDKSGYTFTERDGYQEMRTKLLDKTYSILIVKDLSRMSRRTGEGLVEVETLRDAGVRLISISECIDYSKTHQDDWDKIRFTFMFNENPVTESSKKVKRVIENRQSIGQWVCSVPYGYYFINRKKMIYDVDEMTVPVINKIYELYLEGDGYRTIAKYLNKERIPTPRMVEKMRIDVERARNGDDPCNIKAGKKWNIASVQEILRNDFYIGTLRQRKYTREKINGKDVKLDENEQLVFENAHKPIVDAETFAKVQEQLKLRTRGHYRGVKKYDTHLSGFLFCADCGEPMVSRSNPRLAPQYICGKYHKEGLEGCTAHTVRVDLIDTMIKKYVEQVMLNSKSMIATLEKAVKEEPKKIKPDTDTIKKLQIELETKNEELINNTMYRNADIERAKKKYAKDVVQAEIEKLFDMYEKIDDKIRADIQKLEEQLAILSKKRNTTIQTNRMAKTALDIFRAILDKDVLDKNDIALVVDRIWVGNDNIEIQLKADITMLLETGKVSKELLETSSFVGGTAVNFNWDTKSILNAQVVQEVKNQKDKAFSVTVLSKGDPLEIYTEKDGGVIFRKYSPMGDLQDFASQICEAIGSTTGRIAAVSDRDAIIALSGAPKRELLDKPNSEELGRLMEQRRHYRYESGSPAIPAAEGADKYRLGVASPILSQGDLMGCVMLLLGEGDAPLTEPDQKLAQTVAEFLGKQMES